MALDVYVGSLSRYYSHNWETVAEAQSRAEGVPFKTIRPDTRPLLTRIKSRITGVLSHPCLLFPWLIPGAVMAWRQRIKKRMHRTTLEWDESKTAPYFTDCPTWGGYGALLLWAAYNEYPDLANAAPVEDKWQDDPAYIACVQNRVHTSYPNLLMADCWLPAVFHYLFLIEDIFGSEQIVGSSERLLVELGLLNHRTWKADDLLVSQWGRVSNMAKFNFESMAKYGFAVFYKLATLSVEHKLPMKLDY